jgi:hypothetical protein
VNERIARRLAAELLMIKARLGQQVDLEPWDKGWIRLYETEAGEVFDKARAARTGARMAELIRVIWPLCVAGQKPSRVSRKTGRQ